MNQLQKAVMLAVTGAALTMGGCVERRLTIGSSPEGALVYLNDMEVGRTPVTVPFKWYGDYDLRFRLEKNVGTPEERQIKRWYLHTHKKTETPWFQFFVVDLFADLVPVPFKDEQVWAFEVPEVKASTDAELIDRAQQLKGELNKEESRQNK